MTGTNKHTTFDLTEVEVIAIKEALYRETARLKYSPPHVAQEDMAAYEASALRIIATNEAIISKLEG